METQTHDFYAKTPLPDPETLGMLEMGASHLTEILPDACVCGRPIAFLSYKAAIENVNESSKGNNSLDAYKSFATKYNLALCCRTRILAPVVSNIVSADVGARRIEFGASQKPTIENSPSAGTSLSSCLPPQIISKGV